MRLLERSSIRRTELDALLHALSIECTPPGRCPRAAPESPVRALGAVVGGKRRVASGDVLRTTVGA